MYVFIIFGAFSIAVGLIAVVILPDLPSTAKFLNERERAIAVERVAINRQGIKNNHFKWDQVWQAMRDPKTWLLFIMAVGAQVPNAAITSFTSIIVKSFGFDTLGTQYLQIPGGAVQFLSLLGGGIIATKYADRFHTRSISMIVANLICILDSSNDSIFFRVVGQLAIPAFVVEIHVNVESGNGSQLDYISHQHTMHQSVNWPAKWVHATYAI